MQTDITQIARNCFDKLRQRHNGTFVELLQDYSQRIENRRLEARTNAVGAMVQLFNATNSKIVKAWLLAAIHQMTNHEAQN
jgi:hypothetical protein